MFHTAAYSPMSELSSVVYTAQSEHWNLRKRPGVIYTIKSNSAVIYTSKSKLCGVINTGQLWLSTDVNSTESLSIIHIIFVSIWT